MLTLHHLENSRSQRILWLLEELGVEYELKQYQRNKKSNLAPPELIAVHPLGKSPVLTCGEKTIAESGAIVEYLLAHHGGQHLIPKRDTPEHLRYRHFMHYAEGTVMPLMVMSLIFNTVVKKSPFLIKPIAKGIADQVNKSYLGPNLSRNLKFMEDALNESLWFAGDELSGADFMMVFAVEGAEVRSGLGKYPKLEGFLKRVRAREGYQAALKRGGPYSLKSGR